MPRSNRSYIILPVIALLLGGIIYVFVRPSEPIFFNWIRSSVPDAWLMSARHYSLSQNLHFPDWFIFSLPNGLWAFAYSFLVTSTWWRSQSWLKYFWMASIPILVLGFEILQITDLIRGTFCIQDIIFGVGGIMAGIIIGKKPKKLNSYENNT